MKRYSFVRSCTRAAVVAVVASVLCGGLATEASATVAPPRALLWAAEARTGNVVLKGEVPLAVNGVRAKGTPTNRLIGQVAGNADLSLNFGLPLRNMKGLENLIVAESKTHHEWTRNEIYAHFSPPVAQYRALRVWLKSQGMVVTHVGRDRLLLTVKAKTSVIERALHVTIKVYRGSSYVNSGVLVPAQDFYANINNPTVPARLGIQSITGLTNVDSPDLFTDLQLTAAALHGPAAGEEAAHSIAPFMTKSHAITPLDRSSGYYGRDLRALYDAPQSHNYAAGETTGYTLWGAAEQQGAATAYGTNTGDTAGNISPLTVDPNCTASGNSPTVPSSCTSIQEAPNHILSILENGNTNNEYGGNDETGLDVEVSHGMAPGDAEKYYLGDCSATPSPGLTNGGSCNGSDVGLEDAVEDAANDPTLHSVSNSYGYGGEPEFGATDPLTIAWGNSFAVAAAAGTTFWFSTGDTGSYESGFPADSENVVSVGGSSIFSTAALAANTAETATATNGTSTLTFSTANATTLNTDAVTQLTGAGITGYGNVVSINTGTGVVTVSGVISTLTASSYEFYTSGSLSSADVWDAAGTWCSNVFARPAWQTGPGVTANASCPGHAIPDIVADADTNTPVYECYTTNTGGSDSCGSVGGTSVAGPIMNGLEADTEAFVAAQNYPSSTPAVGFEGPVMYDMGNSANYSDYFRDVECGNDADPTSGPDGESAQPGWDEASGWGEIDWQHYSTGYAQQLGAEGLPTPSSLNQNYQWDCAATPGNPTEHGISFPSSSVGYSAGTDSGTPWFGEILGSAWGATNDFVKTTNGGQTWVPVNADMIDVTCTSSTTCLEVGDGGVIQLTTNSGATWTSTNNTGFKQALTQIQCPSSTVCFAAGDRGEVLQSSNGGASWSFSPSVDGNPIYGLSCPSTTTCYAVDNYAHVMVTTNGGSSWSMQTTPVTTPAINVPGSGGPNPYSGLFGISCPSTTTCVAVGGFPQSGNQEPIVYTTNGGSTWTLVTAGDTSNTLWGVNCLTGTTTCYAVGNAGVIYTTTNLTSWTSMTSGTTKDLMGIDCLSTTYCVATGQTGTIDVYNGSSWTVTSTTLGTSAFLANVSCLTENDCFASGHGGLTVNFDSTNVAATITQLNGGTFAGTIEALNCPSVTNCIAVGTSGAIIATTNGGQTWLTQTDPYGTSPTLEGVSCSGSDCAIVATSGDTLYTTNFGTTWTEGTSGVTVTIEGVSCTSAFCAAVTAVAPTDSDFLVSPLGSGTWTHASSGVAAALDGINCVTTSCQAGGAVVSGHPILFGTSNSGSSWTQETAPASATEALSSVACVDANDCFAGGANGSVIVTNNGGTTWYQEGNPMSGPLSALNTGTTSSILAIDGAACSTSTCAFAGGADGDILVTNLVTVTVNISGNYGQTPNISLAPSNSGIAYSPSIEPSVTGTLTCSTNATNTSPGGNYSISNCSGLAASGYNFIYNYAGSSYTVIPNPSATINSPAGGGTYRVGQSVGTTFSCAEGGGGPGLVTNTGCSDNNGTSTTSGGAGSLATGSAGDYTYTVTATSQDGLTGTASINYAVATPPTATITSPLSGNVYSQNESVTTTFHCTESTYGTGIASCDDNNSTSGSTGTIHGSLNTSALGNFTYTVTAVSSDGQSSNTSISYTVAAGPSVSISSPASGGVYAVGESVSTSFSCSEGTDGPGLVASTGCSDNNGTSTTSGGAGTLNTASAGDYTYTVTATSQDGQTNTASITYTVAAAPTATISSPASGGVYAVGQSVATTFSCTDSTYGTGIASCDDNNGTNGTNGTIHGTLDTSSPGAYVYTVTATSHDGQTDQKSISYIVAAAPSATIHSPSSGGTYKVGQSVTTSFSCAEGSFGPGLVAGTGCEDSNGSTSGSGTLVTSPAGDYTYTVTATSQDGQVTTASISYTVAAAPTAAISSPASGSTFAVGEVVSTGFNCAEGAFGPGLVATTGCEDSNGSTSGTGSLTTSSTGHFTYTVTATSKDGQTDIASISYTVATGPTAAILTPQTGGIYSLNQSVPTSFSCDDSTFGQGISTCTDSNGSTNGTGHLVTSSLGNHSYTVTAVSSDSQSDTATINYTVAAPPTAQVLSPATGGSYKVGQIVGTSFSCTEGDFGPGIASCVDSNGATGGTGTLDTTTPGHHTYTVTATSSDGQTGTASITYTVIAAPIATITSPATGKSFGLDSTVATHFSCTDSTYGPGITSCKDSNGVSGGTGSLVTSTLGNFTYSVTAKSSDGQSTTTSISYTVVKATPTVKITANPSKAKSGPVTYTVTVTGIAGTPTGSVTVTGKTSSCHIGALASGKGHCAINEPAGTFRVSAAYSGNANYAATTGHLEETVAKATPSVTVTAPASPKRGFVTYTVKVTGRGPTPTGTVTVSDGTHTCHLTLNAGKGTCKINEPVGKYNIVASYHGDSNYVSGVGVVMIKVTR
jgi:photosystem II stability/assembly factor-like uncharacterized protein